MPAPPHHHVAIVGTGFGGLGAAIRLLQEGFDDLVVFERAGTIGGVWRDNVYPGAACDVQSHLYAFSFAPNPDWSRRFSPQQEIQAYLHDVAERFGVLPHVRFGHEVRDAAWDDEVARWRVDTSRGLFTADVLVAAPGALAEPKLPDVPGLDTFEGVVMHTSRWDPEVDLAGRHVAVVGTGASAIQVVPAIQPEVGHLTLYQRTAPWVMPRGDRALSERVRRQFQERPWVQGLVRTGLYGFREGFGLAFRHPRLAEQAEKLARRHLDGHVSSPDLRRVLTPDYRIGCKRILLSDDYYPAVSRPNVTVVDGALTEVHPRATVGPDGVERPTDVIVFATGFYVTDSPFAACVAGRGGLRLDEAWSARPAAHLGTTVAGFPNFFLVQGPNTGLGHSSVVLMAEAQIEHVVNALRTMRQRKLAAVEPTSEAQAAWIEEVDARTEGTVWTAGGCASWYLDETGRNVALWPGSVPAFRRRVGPFDPGTYRLRPLGAASGDGEAGPPPRPPAPVATTPSAWERVRGTVARALGHLPDAVQSRLAAGPPPEIDGQPLDPAVHLLLTLDPREDAAPTVRRETVRARARLRRDVLSIAGPRTRVGDVCDLQIEGADGPLAARLYTPAGVGRPPLLVYAHGGGFVEGDIDTHDEPCRLLCRQAGHAVLSVAYRLAPEHPFPAAFDDVLAAFRWAQREAARLGADPARVAVGGDSAGGNLAAGVAQATRDDAPPVAQLLIYPATDHPTSRPSRRLFDGYLLPDDLRQAFFDVYTRGTGADGTDWRLSPLYGRLDGLPPAFVVTAGFDVLRDEGEAYARALDAAGTPTALYRQASLPHGFVHLTPVSPAAERAAIAIARRWRQFVIDHP